MANIMILEPSAFSMKLLEYEFVKAKKKYKILYKLRTLKNIQEKPELSKVDIVLIDACLDEGSGGIDVAIQIKKCAPNIKVIIMSSVPEHSFLKKAKSCGCDGFWYKEDEESMLSILPLLGLLFLVCVLLQVFVLKDRPLFQPDRQGSIVKTDQKQLYLPELIQSWFDKEKTK